MASGRGDFVDQKLADLDGQITQFGLRQVLQIGGPTDLFKHFASVRRGASPRRGPAVIPFRRTPLALRNHTDKPAKLCPGVPGSLVGVIYCAVRGLPAITRNSGVQHDLHGRHDRALRADVRVQRRDHDLTPIGCGARILRTGSPPMLTQARVRRRGSR